MFHDGKAGCLDELPCSVGSVQGLSLGEPHTAKSSMSFALHKQLPV